MKKLMLIVTFSLFGGAASAATYPMFNEKALEGVKTFDARYRTNIWMNEDRFSDLTLPDLNRFEENANNAFILGLRRDGVTVDETSRDVLDCDISASISNRIVTFVIELNYFKFSFEAESVHTLLWGTNAMANVGIDNFTSEIIAKQCQDLFAAQWLKWNPK